VRSIDTRNILKVEFADDQYARQFADRLLATRIMTGFGLLAFVVAAAGIYGVMAFLVANRAREIGIRMALGADSRRIRRLLASSMWLVFLGSAIGIGRPRRRTVGTITAVRRQSHGPGDNRAGDVCRSGDGVARHVASSEAGNQRSSLPFSSWAI
jgi:hypothetical protein